ncbi:MAG: hypothetical protein FJ241_10655 [Nitrospira sp.]|nr:hypothetical protein [Nitrospira sp.]
MWIEDTIDDFISNSTNDETWLSENEIKQLAQAIRDEIEKRIPTYKTLLNDSFPATGNMKTITIEHKTMNEIRKHDEDIGFNQAIQELRQKLE